MENQNEARINEIIEQHSTLVSADTMQTYMTQHKAEMFPETDPVLRQLYASIVKFYDNVLTELRDMGIAVASGLADRYQRIKDFLTRKLEMPLVC